MNGKLMAGVLAAALWGGVALANEYNVNTSTQPPQAQPQYSTQPSDQLNGTTIQDNQAGAVVTTPDRQDLNVNIKDNNKPIVVKEKDNKDHLRGASVSVGGGVEGYTGALASQLRAGPAWDVNLGLRPTKVFGIELGYTGAVNQVGSGYGGLNSFSVGSGPSVIRNGGRALATLGLTASRVQPYLLGGIGLDHYSVNGGDAAGVHNANVAAVPLGAGVRTFIRGFTADARFGTSFLLNNNGFSDMVAGRSIAGVNSVNATRYQGTLSIGANF